MNALIVLLGALVAEAIAVPAYFPHDKTVVYKYTVDVKAGIIDPAPFASQFGIECLLHVKHDVSDPTLRNAYRVTLTDVKHGLFNGHSVHYEHLSSMVPITDVVKTINTPFLIVYDENGHLQGVKLADSESPWSRNIKKSIASMLQLDLVNIHVQTPVKSHSFITHEHTIHGTCQVAYDVHPTKHEHPSLNKVFTVTKIHEPKNCTHFVHHVFNHVEPEKCHVQEEDGMTTASRRVFEIEDMGNEILIKKLVGHSVINYFPWLANSEAHYLLTNQTMIVQDISESDVQAPSVDLQSVPITHDISFSKPQAEYLNGADVDVTQGRHVVKLNDLVFKLKKMLDEAAVYLKENHIEKKQPDWKHGQTINRLLHVMRFMNLESMEQVFSELQDAKNSKEVAMKNIFLGIVPHVGTTAACLFTRNVIHEKKVSNLTAMMMLVVLPMHVKVPSKELLLQMEQFLNFDDSVSVHVRQASIFCFATLIHKTFKNKQVGVTDPLLDRYLQHFMEHVKNEPTYEMKMVYMRAMKNVGLNNILKPLEPIIRGDVVISEKPHNVRMEAIKAIKRVVVDLPHYTHDLLWPVLADVNLPVAVRIAAYDVLMHQLPHVGRIMNIYWFMVYEKNEHLYNYHVETIKGLANTVDPCMMSVRENARKILRFTRMRHVPGPLSSKFHVDYVDEKFGHGETVKASLIVNHMTGLPDVGSVEHLASVARKPVHKWGVHWNIDGLNVVMKDFKQEVFGKAVVQAVRNENVKNVLTKAAKDMPMSKDVDIDVALTLNDHVVSMFHSNERTWMDMLHELKQWKQFMSKYMSNVHLQSVVYDNHFEMHVPTDFGVPAVLATRMPSFESFKLNTDLSEGTNLLGFKVHAKYQGWKHGEHVMSIYNPLADVWHGIHRTSSLDVAVPVEMNVGFNLETKNLKVTLPRLPVSEFSVAGITTNAKNYITITEDETNFLRKTCETCRHYELVSNNVSPIMHEESFDSKDTGLRYSIAAYDCEDNVTAILPMGEWMKTILDPHKNTMGSSMVHFVMGIRQQIMNNMISSQGASCASLMKVEPSIIYPTSLVDLNGKFSVQDLDVTHDKLHVLSGKRIDIRGNMNVKAASTNESVRQWDMNLNVVLSQGHVNNSVKVIITRTTPQEDNLKICIDAQKDYPSVEHEVGKKETNSKIKVTMGHTKEDKCVHDEMDVTMIVKGEMSEEQKKRIAHDNVHGVCAKHMRDPLYHTATSQIPKTSACMRENVHHTTLRKYTVQMVLRKVPSYMVAVTHLMQDTLRAVFFPHVKYSMDHVDPGNAKVVVEYLESTPFVDATVVNPTHSYELQQLPFGHPVWNLGMDNIRFDVVTLYKHMNGLAKMCTIYPRVLLTFDNGTLPFIVPDKWLLISGDHVDRTYGVFVKLVGNSQLAVKVFVSGHEMEIVPHDSGATVTVNNRVVDNYMKGVIVPENEPESYAMKMTYNFEHVIVQSMWVPMMIFCTPNSVTVALDSALQGQVTGMCGHMDGTHQFEIPKIYSVSHL